MKNLQNYEEFLFEANLSNEILKFKKGDVVVTTKFLDPKELNFKKSALTWWGSNISALQNIFAKEASKEGKTYDKGNVLFIFTEDGQLDKKGRGYIVGYQGGFYDTTFAISEWTDKFEYDQYVTQLTLLAVLNGYAEVIPYSKLDKKTKEEFENSTTSAKVRDYILSNKHKVQFMNMLVTDYSFQSSEQLVLKGYDVKTGDQLPNKLVSYEDLLTNVTVDNKPIEKNPFK